MLSDAFKQLTATHDSKVRFRYLSPIKSYWQWI